MHPWARSVLVVAVVATVFAAPVASVASTTTVASTATPTDDVDRPAPDGLDASLDGEPTDWSATEFDDESDEDEEEGDDEDVDDDVETDDDERDGDDTEDENEREDEDDREDDDGEAADDDDDWEWDWDGEDEEDDEDEENDDESWWDWWSSDDEGSEDDRERDSSRDSDGDAERGNDESGDGDGTDGSEGADTPERGSGDRSSDDRQSAPSNDEDAAAADRPDDGSSGSDESSGDRTERVDSQEDDETQGGEESQEGERNATRNGTAEPGPALGSSTVTVLRTPEVVGQPLVVTATTSNRGTEPGRKVVQFEVEHEIVDREVFVLQPNETRTVTFTHVFATPGNKTFEVDAGLNRFVTVEERRPSLSVAAVEATPDAVEAGDEVTITALVSNDGYANGSLPVALELFGEVVAVENVTLATGESAEVTFTRTVYAPGSYQAAVGNETAAFRVADEPATESAAPANESSPESSVETDGFGRVAALAGVLVALALALSRRG